MLNQGVVENKAEAVDVKEYLAVLLKRKWLVLVCFLLSMAGTTAFLFTRQPIFRANAKLLVTSPGQAVPTTEVVREEASSFYATQIDIMLSQTMLKRVQQRMKKTADEIRENLTDVKVAPVRGSDIILVSVDSPSRDFAREFANTLCDEYLRFRDEERAKSNESAVLMLTREINRLRQELNASNEKMLAYAKEHNMGQLEKTADFYTKRWYSAADQMANASIVLAEAQTRKEILDTHPDATRVLALLGTPTGALATNAPAPAAQNIAGNTNVRVAVQEDNSDQLLRVDSDGAIAHPQLGLITVAGLTADEAAQKIKSGLEKNFLRTATVRVTVEPDRASTNRDEANAGMQTPSAPAASGYDRSSLAALNETQAQQLFQLETKRRNLETRLEEMRRIYKPKHPSLVQSEQELVDVKAQVDSQIQFIQEKAQADLDVAWKNWEKAKAMAERMNQTALGDTAQIMEMKVMKDEADRIQLLYNTLMSQFMKIDVTQGFNPRTVSVLEPAILEPEAVYPKKVKGLLIAAFFGIGLGLALAFFIEYIDDSIKLAEEVERDLQLPFLGMIPAAQWSPDDLTAHRLDKLKQQGGVAEAYRVVRSAIIFSTPREKLRSILLTSAVPREGKTTTCVNLSIGFAQIEERVLLIDGDLRRGEVHKYFGFDREKGMSDVLLGEATCEQVVRHTSVPKLDVITSGAYPANPAELLLGWRLKDMLEWAYKNYDRVIIDCTPVMGIADSAILGSAVDGCLFVIWAGRTSRRYVRVAKMTAVSRGAKIFGFVLNNLEPGRVGYYHYYPYYYSYYTRGYYNARPEEEEAGKGGDIKGIEVPSPEGGEEQIDDVY